MTRSPAAALALGLLSSLAPALPAATLTACRGGLDAVCHCASDCRAGLVCEAEGEKTLSAEMCFAPGTNGRCVEAEAVDSDASDPQVATEAPSIKDFPSRRDFGGGSGTESDSATGTTAPTTTDATGTDTGTSTSTGTTGTTGTSTSTTGTDTGTSTTGTSTGTTGTTGTGTSTGTSTSTGSSSSSSSSSTT